MTFRSRYFELSKISESIYVSIAHKSTAAMSNAGIVDLGDETLVFDTMYTPQAAADLRKAAEELFHRPVRYVVNSHFHMDHVGGNQVFVDSTVISTLSTRNLIVERVQEFLSSAKTNPEEYLAMPAAALEKESDELTRQLGDIDNVEEALPHFSVRLPDMTFAHSMTLYGSNQTAVLETKGGGHTPSDSYLYLPDQEVVFLGDLICVGNHPGTRDANLPEWVRILEELEKLPFRLAVSGHGPVGTKQELLIFKEYLQWVMHSVTEKVRKGATAEEVVKTKMPPAFSNWDVSGLYSRNLQTFYQFLESHPCLLLYI